MLIRRRALFAALPAVTLPLVLPGRRAMAADERLADRSLGDPKAPVHVQEWFSLTCTHCAQFQTAVFPEVRTKLIDTGKIFYTYRDQPIDPTALLAAMVARSLPVDRYEPFVSTVLGSLYRWAFSTDGQPKDAIAGLKQIAALAGLSSNRFDAIRQDDGLRDAIIARAGEDATRYNIGGTPYFRFNDTPHDRGPETFDEFADLVHRASP
ncbi:thioredoxin domain-containing protein [Brytella acorum]|uniref:Thioredoxin domain-containing protein n=1 Tax=Brytella acorum TaxID=2959299 RepID=A0AA35XWC5_9PROT|nr:thioredoxin domain-containing protein [Brytella acorum]MDF3624198.1 thioredoxin domain-containing protein [Brytella acorum]CAI9120704.1 thioredoxin domain-containing protein [Brytella acorum]